MTKVWVSNYLNSLPSMCYVHRLLKNTHAKQTSLVVQYMHRARTPLDKVTPVINLRLM